MNKPIQHYKHLFFDLDDTLTLSRSSIDQDMHALLRRVPVNLIAVSGAVTEQIKKQLSDAPFYHLGQNGNHAQDKDGSLIWERRLTEEEKREVLAHVEAIRRLIDWDIPNYDDLLEDRGSQMSFSLLGHTHVVSEKKKFDPTSERRFSLLEKIPFVSDNVEVKVGGTTCLDYFKKNSHKGSNIDAFITHMGWEKDDCLFFGDKLMPGGNDESVIGVIDTIAVLDHCDTYTKLRDAFFADS
jgi:phosphomannomutase